MTLTSDRYQIRLATPQDDDALYEICLKTADSGRDATELYSDRRLPGYVWAAPYGALEPAFTFVLAAGERAIGYVLATPDTTAFEQRLETEWWPKVRGEIANFKPTRPLDSMVLERIAEPEGHAAWLLADYPAHLHINILPEAQGSGWGRRLIEAELAALKAHGVRGVHLGVSPTNAPAIGFYSHVGFTDISREEKVTFGMRFTP